MKDHQKLNQTRQRALKRRSRRRDLQDPVIGFTARRGTQILCNGNACIVAGTPEAMAAILQAQQRDPAKFEIESARSRHILAAIGFGGVYDFDEQAYGRFLPVAQRFGLPLDEADFSDAKSTDIRFIRVGI